VFERGGVGVGKIKKKIKQTMGKKNGTRGGGDKR